MLKLWLVLRCKEPTCNNSRRERKKEREKEREREREKEREKLNLESKQAVHSFLIYNAEEKAQVFQLQQQNILMSPVNIPASLKMCGVQFSMHVFCALLQSYECVYIYKGKKNSVYRCVFLMLIQDVWENQCLSSPFFPFIHRYTMTEGLWRQYRESDVMQLQTLRGIRRNITHCHKKHKPSFQLTFCETDY